MASIFEGQAAFQRYSDNVLTVGTFDGLHSGHQALLATLKEQAAADKATPAVLTFAPHPRTVLRKENVPVSLLTSTAEKIDLLAKYGVERIYIAKFDREFAAMPPEQFIEHILIERIGLRTIVLGYDHHFGRGRDGDANLLRKYGDRHGFSVHQLNAVESGAKPISSSRIREALLAGDLQDARKLLGRDYTVRGSVIEGAKRGRTIGYPTANIKLDEADKIMPANGVYVASLEMAGTTWQGMANLGVKPTFNGHERALEIFIFDFDQQIYGAEVTLTFHTRLRDEVKFSGIDALKNQLDKDQEQARAYFKV